DPAAAAGGVVQVLDADEQHRWRAARAQRHVAAATATRAAATAGEVALLPQVGHGPAAIADGLKTAARDEKQDHQPMHQKQYTLSSHMSVPALFLITKTLVFLATTDQHGHLEQ